MPISFNFHNRPIKVEPEKFTIVDDGETMIKMCSEGLGLTLVPHFTAKEMVLKGKVKVIAKIDDFENSGVFIVYPKRKHLPKRTKLFIEFVKDYLARNGESPSNTWLKNLNSQATIS